MKKYEIAFAADPSEDDLRALALGRERVQKHLGGEEPRRFIYIPGRLVNIVR